MPTHVERIGCPLCRGLKSTRFAEENGFTAVKCSHCGLVYVNPRPSLDLISKAVTTGFHSEVPGGRSVVVARAGRNVALYRRLLKEIFNDAWSSSKPLSWLDVGAGYGEFLEAVSSLSPKGSTVVGVEPMKPKADAARKRGLSVTEAYISHVVERFDVISLMNVFSHIPDFRSFLIEAKQRLNSGGELLIETGNIGDLAHVKEAPTDLDLPDHLVFAGESHMVRFLQEADFEVIDIKRRRKDGFINFLKNIARRLVGRPVSLAIPYSSPYRSLLIRARLKASPASR